MTASLLGVGVISIYAYSILSVKQEKFLDEIDWRIKIIIKKLKVIMYICKSYIFPSFIIVNNSNNFR